LKENNNNSSNSSSNSTANQIDINNIQEFVDANTVEIDEPPAVTFPHRPAPDFSEFDEYNEFILTDIDEEDSS